MPLTCTNADLTACSGRVRGGILERVTSSVGIIGSGRLGSLIARAVGAADDLDLAWSTGREGPGSLAPVDVAIDVSVADAVPHTLEWALATGTDLVIGTTGWDPAALDVLPDPAPIGVLVAPNFSLSVALLGRLAAVLGRYARTTRDAGGEVDLAVTDLHHRAKVDAPSGTARMLTGALADAAGVPEPDVQVTSLRLGTAVGRHEVLYRSPTETLTIGHEALTREVFADGALEAARWIRGRRGVHTLDDLAADRLADVLAA